MIAYSFYNAFVTIFPKGMFEAVQAVQIQQPTIQATDQWNKGMWMRMSKYSIYVSHHFLEKLV